MRGIRCSYTRNLPLIRELQEEFFPWPCKPVTKKELQDTSWLLATATATGIVAGYAGILPTSNRTAYVSAMGVREPYRGVGLQRLMGRKLLALARASGVTEVESHVAACNWRSLNNMVGLGFRANGSRWVADAGDGKSAEYIDLHVILGGKK